MGALADQVTALIITHNEEPNIVRTLDRLNWVKRILVVDSGSTDKTVEILSRYPQVQMLQRPFDTFAEQCNFGLSQVRTEWVLSIDADYVISEELIKEIGSLSEGADVSGFKANFVYCIHGRKLRGSIYPPRVVLYRSREGVYRNEGHGHRIGLSGKIVPLRHPIYHDDRKSLSLWLGSQQRYAGKEADYLLSARRAALSRTDRIRRTGWIAPLAVFPYVLFWRGCIRDGWAGWYYALQRLLAEVMIALELVDRKLQNSMTRTRHAGLDSRQ